MTMWKWLLVMNLQRCITWTCRSPQRLVFLWVSAHCLAVWSRVEPFCCHLLLQLFLVFLFCLSSAVTVQAKTYILIIMCVSHNFGIQMNKIPSHTHHNNHHKYVCLCIKRAINTVSPTKWPWIKVSESSLQLEHFCPHSWWCVFLCIDFAVKLRVKRLWLLSLFFGIFFKCFLSPCTHKKTEILKSFWSAISAAVIHTFTFHTLSAVSWAANDLD